MTDPDLVANDEALDSTILAFYTWKRGELVKDAALQKIHPEGYLNLLQVISNQDKENF
jgi:hypothetical protein